MSLAMSTVKVVGAGFESVTVPTEGEPPGTVLGFSETARLVPVIVSVSEALLLPYDATIVALAVAVTMLVGIVKVADVWPTGMTRIA